MMKKSIKSLILIFCISMLAGVFFVEDSRSFFADSVKMTGTVISTGFWDTTPEYGAVIINEIHRAGSPASSNDQWIELFNTTEKDISLKNWTIENAGRSPKGLKITGNATIEAGGFLLITGRNPNSAESALAVTSDVINASLYLDRDEYEPLILKDSRDNEIDRTPDNSPWPAGVYNEGKKYFSMQRDGDLNWYTCIPSELTEDDHSIMKGYWKEDFAGEVCGTPGYPNLPSGDNDHAYGDGENIEVMSTEDDEKTFPDGEIKGTDSDKQLDDGTAGSEDLKRSEDPGESNDDETDDNREETDIKKDTNANDIEDENSQNKEDENGNEDDELSEDEVDGTDEAIDEEDGSNATGGRNEMDDFDGPLNDKGE